MTQLSQELMNQAEAIRLSSPTEIAVGLLKEAGFSDKDARYEVDQAIMEKEAASFLASSSGIDIEQAIVLVKAAGVNLKDLVTYEQETTEVDPTADLLEKAAKYIESLEAEIEANKETLEKAAEAQAIEEVVLPASITKAAHAGAFTNEDLEVLKRMEPELLSKVASASEPAWEMGRGSGMERPQTDALLEFILS
jgi:hypothetical protein